MKTRTIKYRYGWYYWRGHVWPATVEQRGFFKKLGAKGREWTVRLTYDRDRLTHSADWHEVSQMGCYIIWRDGFKVVAVCGKAWTELFGPDTGIGFVRIRVVNK